MALAPLVLDDLRWDEMVSAVRARIPGASAGQWTLHSPTDPGITLLELFAWLLEQRLYWLDQVPDDLARALLRVLDESPRPARAAHAALELAVDPAHHYESVPAGTRFGLDDPEVPRVLTLLAGVLLFPVVRFDLTTREGDRTAALADRRPVDLLPAHGAAAEARLDLWLAAPVPPAPPDGELTLLIDLDTAPELLPDWHPEAPAGVEPPAEIQWLFGGGAAGPEQPFPAVADGTGGLRRSGIVRLRAPAGWQASGPADAAGAVPFSITLRTAAANFTAPPRLRHLAANAVPAAHWQRTQPDPGALADQARRWLRLPGQRLALDSEVPPPLTPSVSLRLLEREGWRLWRPVPDFAFACPEDRVFTVDREGRTVTFGDGLTGRVPVPRDPDAPELRLVYRAGGGGDGAVGGCRRWTTKLAGTDLPAVNSAAPVGAAEPETVAEAARRAAAGLRRVRRAVTAADYEELAETTPGVAITRARAAIGHHPLHPCAKVPGAVTVFVVPWAPRPGEVPAPVADPGALAAVERQLDAARLVGTRVFVRPVSYRRVSLVLEFGARPVDPAALEARLFDGLAEYLDPLTGGGAGTGWPFGEPVRPSALLRRAQRLLGEEGTVIGAEPALDGAAPAAEARCRDLEIGDNELVYLERLTVRYAPADGEIGGLP